MDIVEISTLYAFFIFFWSWFLFKLLKNSSQYRFFSLCLLPGPLLIVLLFVAKISYIFFLGGSDFVGEFSSSIIIGGVQLSIGILGVFILGLPGAGFFTFLKTRK
jgi:hypothetical protein